MRKSVIVWIASVASAAALSAAVSAQVWPNRADPPRILSGPDIGFRVEGIKSGNQTVAVGRLVVRMNGEWIEASESTGLSRLTTAR
jgi:hypothetical protein